MSVKTWWRQVDPGFGLVVAIAFIALWPFLHITSLPQGTDAELHIFRLVELSQLVRGGELYPRWAPDFYHGYGYPIFNYYAPLTYYVGLLVELLPRLDAVDGVKFVLVLGLLLAAIGMYGFVRDNWGRRAGLVATAVYLYAPYLQYVDPHVRGVAPETFSFGIFAIALWSLDRLGREKSGGRWITAVFTTAAVILTHNLMGLLFFGLLCGWVVWRWGNWRLEIGDWGQVGARFWLLPTALAVGLALAAFFWLPVILERHSVNLNTLIGQNDNYDFHTHFLSLRELLAPSQRLDWGATEAAFSLNLGIAQWVLGGLGLVLLGLRRVKEASHLLFFAIAFFVLTFLMLPASTFLWEATPILPFFQFPWRLLGGAAAMLAVLAGGGTAVLLQQRSWLTAVFVTLPILLGLPLSVPAPWDDFGPANLITMTEIELRGRWLGTTSTADYVPVTVEVIPRRQEKVVENFFLGLPPQRLNLDALPDAATATWETVTPLHFRYTVTSPKPFPLRLFHFYFPGWRATVDGEPAEIDLGLPEGFMVVSVPAGTHVVEFKFGTTPGRTIAWGMSGVALLLTLLLGWRQSRQSTNHQNDHAKAQRRKEKQSIFAPLRLCVKFFTHSTSAEPLTSSEWWVLAAVVGLTAVYLLILQPLNLLHDSSSGFVVESADHAAFADFDSQIALIGYDHAAERLRPGQTLNLTLYWKAEQKLDINYQVFVHLLSTEGVLVVQSDKLNPGDFPTRRWPQDKYVPDRHQLTLPTTLPPGEYTVAVGLWVQTEGWRLPLLGEDGVQLGDNFVLFKIVVE
ncbi:MAG: hypothetical protein H6668_17155 [Ardenticatenaceae bacterium]|nr:hypothetical protein [Ardenticatenaceae bacterium]